MSIYLLRMSLLAILIGFAPGAAHAAALSKIAAKFFSEHIAPHLAVEGAKALERCLREQTCNAGQFSQLSDANQRAILRALAAAAADERVPIAPDRVLTGH
jgi:hypothetical protein